MIMKLLDSILIAFTLNVIYKYGMKLYIANSSSPIKFPTNCDVSLAYLITGSSGDGPQLKRILQAIYHPSNIYIVTLGSDTWTDEYQQLSDYIDGHAVFSEIGNVKLGNISYVQHIHMNWDWLILLDAYSYPVFTQDDLMCALSTLPRHLNFINHASPLFQNSNNFGIYKWHEAISSIGNTTIFKGSTVMALMPSFLDYCTEELPNIPKIIINSEDSFYQTAICNSEKFKHTVVNTDLHFTATWANRNFTTNKYDLHMDMPRFISSDDLHFTATWANRNFTTNKYDLHMDMPRFISSDDLKSIEDSHAPFARKFYGMFSNFALDLIDKKLLFRGHDKLVPGGWCMGTDYGGDRCLRVGNVKKINASKRVWNLVKYFNRYVRNGTVSSPQCVY